MKYKYETYLPTWASVKTVLESDEPLEGEALVKAMLDRGEVVGRLCHQCANDIESALEVDYDEAEKTLTADDIWER